MQQLTRNFHTEQYFDFATSQMFTPATSEQAADSVFPPPCRFHQKMLLSYR